MSLTLTLTLERRDPPTVRHYRDLDHTPPPGTLTVRSGDLDDETVHRWFRLFEQVLLLAGFSEETICQGACGLAFNELRAEPLMRATAAAFDLAAFLPPDGPHPASAGAASDG